jgi:tetratricopeptide (TPR) repeat protein
MARFRVNAARLLAITILLASSVFRGQSVQGQAAQTQPEAAASATLQGTVRDSGGHPVAGATVRLQAQDAQILAATTDSKGAYRFSAVRQGPYTLRAEISGYVQATFGPLVLGAKEPRTIDLTLQSARTAPSQNSSSALPEFFDEPHFTVAGVTDTTNLGGHGSDAIVRNREALASATASLKKEPSANAEDEAGRHHALAEADEKAGDSLQAVREFQRAAELNPSEPNLFDWGTELLLHRAAEPAIEVFTKGNRLFPRSVRMLAGLGASWYSFGSFDQAAQRLCEASDLNLSDPNSYLFMGKMQAVESAQSLAILQRLERFVRLKPENALANYYYAVSLWKGWKSTDVVEDANRVKSLLEKAIHLDPKLGLASLQLGIVYSEQGDFPQAISAYRQAIEASPQLEQAHYRLAQAYRRVGETSKAHAELQLYEQISAEKTEEVERQRHELQQFVYSLRDATLAPPQ